MQPYQYQKDHPSALQHAADAATMPLLPTARRWGMPPAGHRRATGVVTWDAAERAAGGRGASDGVDVAGLIGLTGRSDLLQARRPQLQPRKLDARPQCRLVLASVPLPSGGL